MRLSLSLSLSLSLYDRRTYESIPAHKNHILEMSQVSIPAPVRAGVWECVLGSSEADRAVYVGWLPKWHTRSRPGLYPIFNLLDYFVLVCECDQFVIKQTSSCLPQNRGLGQLGFVQDKRKLHKNRIFFSSKGLVAHQGERAKKSETDEIYCSIQTAQKGVRKSDPKFVHAETTLSHNELIISRSCFLSAGLRRWTNKGWACSRSALAAAW